MKSDRRHELQQNELANYLGRINRSIEPYSRIIAIVVGAAILGTIAYGLYNSKNTGERSDATLQLIQATGSGDAEVLAQVGDNFPDTPAGVWSRLYQANEYLGEGIRTLFINRGNAEETLDQARITYQEALDASTDPLLRSRANFGIARASEARGDIDAAIAAYKDCIAANESEAMIKKAQERIDSLSTPETQKFLVWFSEQDFSPADPSLPPSLPGGATLPDLPDLNLPKLSLPDLGAESSDKDLSKGIPMPEQSAADAPTAKENGEAKENGTAKESGPAKENGTAKESGEATESGADKDTTDPAANGATTDKAAGKSNDAAESTDSPPTPEDPTSAVENPKTPSGDADEPATDDAGNDQE